MRLLPTFIDSVESKRVEKLLVPEFLGNCQPRGQMESTASSLLQFVMVEPAVAA